MLAIKATSKKNAGWFWLSSWMQSWKRAEVVKEEAQEIFGPDWNIEIISQYPETEQG
jgi:hypothetical protein